MAVTRQPKRTTTTKVKDPAPLEAPPDQPIPAQPAPRPKDAPRTMKELRLARAGKRTSRAKPMENVLREGRKMVLRHELPNWQDGVNGYEPALRRADAWYAERLAEIREEMNS